ncbi:Smr/MutS family protein [bacterium]|nr:Smr/MutS family protein [candidate division CSSED10-310 bacterium]
MLWKRKKHPNDPETRDDNPSDDSICIDPVIIPIEDCLDLHAFDPREIRDLLIEYLDQATLHQYGIVRIIHGKGRGVLRRITESVCRQHPEVLRWEPAGEDNGGWGATIVYLQPVRNGINGGGIT